MPVGAFIIARLNSSRLTEKHMRRIMGKPMIEMMVERVRAAKTVDTIVITTSSLSSDDQLEELSKKLGICCYRGSLENIMDRIVSAAKTYECDTVVELLGDNPLVHSELIDDVVNYYFRNKYDYHYCPSKSRIKSFAK
jgi:spore coat polysaccharide biosynthesis protein SpsF